MLVLSRKRDESIIISDNIKVTVLGIRGDKVRLGFCADRSIEVMREEIWISPGPQSQEKYDDVESVESVEGRP